MQIQNIDDSNYKTFFNLAQNYEAEFSRITEKCPNEDGLYQLDTEIDEFHKGYLLYENNIPIGFAVVGMHSSRNDIAEFYIIPALRKLDYGRRFAIKLFDMYFGEWQVRQIAGADDAVLFWRAVIKSYTNDNYREVIENDAYWGKITKQIFE